MTGAETRATTEVDRAIGERIRARRQELGLPQTHVAEQVGISFQQLQKYETGDNRVSAAALTRIAQALRIEPAELLPSASGAPARRRRRAVPEDAMALQLQDAFSRVTAQRDRRLILDMARRLAGDAAPAKPKKSKRR
jgi:transcriptional regulator with XRE-family HTH domain